MPKNLTAHDIYSIAVKEIHFMRQAPLHLKQPDITLLIDGEPVGIWLNEKIIVQALLQQDKNQELTD